MLATAHLGHGGLSKLPNTILVACSASVMAYTLNSTILKVIFGRPNPLAFRYKPMIGHFNFFRGDEFYSFPSGHMMLASAFLAVISCAY
jgi:membrane-associated phospholipid phosphatase